MRECEPPRGTLLASGTVVAFHLEAVSGRILGASSAAEAFYGYTKSELCQMNLAELDLEADASVPSDADGHPGGRRFARRHRVRNGEVRDVQINLWAVPEVADGVVFCAIQDVTEEVHIRIDWEKILQSAALLAELSETCAAASPDECDAVVDRALEQVATALDIERIVVWQQTEPDVMMVTHAFCTPGVPGPVVTRLARCEVPWFWGNLDQGVPMVTPDAAELYPAEAKADMAKVRRNTLNAHVVVPLRSGDRLVGAISYANTYARTPWYASMLDGLTLVSATIGNLLARKRDSAVLLERLRFEQVTRELSALFASPSADALDVAIQQLLVRMCELFDADRAAVRQFRRGGRVLETRWAHVRRPELAVAPEDDVWDSVCSWYRDTLYQGEIIAIDDATDTVQMPRYAPEDIAWLERYDIGAVLAAPVWVDGQVTHALMFSTAGRKHDWPKHVRGYVLLLADLIGKAFERRHIAALREEQTHFQEQLAELTSRFAQVLPADIDHLLQSSLDRAAEAFGGAQLALYQHDQLGGLKLTHTRSGARLCDLPARARLTQQEFPWMWQQLCAGENVTTLDPNNAALAAQDNPAEAIGAALAWEAFVPLLVDGELAGVLACRSDASGSQWMGRRLEALTLVGGLFAGLLARRDTHQALLDRLRFEEVVTALATVFANSSSHQLEGAISQLVQRMVELLDCDRGAVAEHAQTGHGHYFRLRYVRGAELDLGPDDGHVELPWYHDRMDRGEVVAITDPMDPDQIPVEAASVARWLQRNGVGAHLGVPVYVNGLVTHHLAFETIRRRREWPDDLQRRVVLVASLVGRALERQEAERAAVDLRTRLAHASRVMATGELAAAFAHQMNQPLAAITANARAAQRFLESGDPDLQEIVEILTDIGDDALRAGGIISHMRGQLSRVEPKSEPVDLVDALREVARPLASEAFGRDVRFDTADTTSSVMVAGDRVQLQQVIVNLVMNAFDALAEVPPKSRRATVGCEADATGTALLYVEDTGPGLPEGNLDVIFETFATTKPDGLGMGLSICRSIAETHGGTLEARSGEAGGARFELRLPALPPSR